MYQSKTYIKGLFLLILFAYTALYASGTTVSKEQAQEWMTKQSSPGFQENKGQMADVNGAPVPFVLFKVQVPDLNIWLTTSGLTYQFFKLKEDENKRSLSETAYQKDEDKITGSWHRVDMSLKSANIKRENIFTEGNITQGEVNFYLGHCAKGIFNVKTYTKITIREIYPGIDWILYTTPADLSLPSTEAGSGFGMKHDFIVHPGADPTQIKLIYEGSGKLKVSSDQIHFENKLGELTEGKLLCYQGDLSAAITSGYSVKRTGKDIGNGFSYEVRIKTGQYNIHETLIIDPQLFWATFYGGSGFNGPRGIDCDANGNLYVAGYSSSVNFPTLAFGGAYYDNTCGGGPQDVYILRFTNTGVLTWATYYGGSGDEFGNAIVCDGAGNVYVTGQATGSFPTLARAGAYNQSVFGGGARDAFVLRFSNTGVLTWATYYGGSGDDIGQSITCDGLNNIYVTGQAGLGFPTQSLAGAYNQAAFGGGGGTPTDAFILRFDNAGTCVWATYYGGIANEMGTCIASDGANNLYVTGQCNNIGGAFPSQAWAGAYNQSAVSGFSDIFILRFSNSGVRTWATLYGGSNWDMAGSILCDASGNIYVTGETNSVDLPIQARSGAYNQAVWGGSGFTSYDIFVLRFTTAGVLNWATYYGGAGNESFGSYDNLETDICGNVYVGLYASTGLYTFGTTTCSQYYDPSVNGSRDPFIIKFSNAGSVLWATFFGGGGNGDFRAALATDNSGNLFVAGEWAAAGGYPVTNPGGGAYIDATYNGGEDAYFAKFIPVVSTYTQGQVNATSCASCNGSATINVSCGNPSYNYVWSNGAQTLNSTSATNTITGLCTGTYTVTVTDAGCIPVPYTTTFTISSVGGPCGSVAVTATGTNACAGDCATAMANPIGGTSPYTYFWSNGAATQNISPCPVSTTTYTVTITDAGGSTATSTTVVTVDPAVIVGATATNITCSGVADGSVIANPGSGTSPYVYSWSAPGGQTTQTVTGLSQGSYTVKVTDSKGCTSTSTTAIISPPPLSGQFNKGTASCSGCGCKEWIMVNATGGTGPYNYLWPDGHINRYKNGLCSGSSTIKITDKNGCSINVNLSGP
ncbi:MAG: SBBP repeat-containing protein [Bacteroidetes bacterium]|nr:SBBP repeat-containing protein [Bacteroidota bacterium]